MSAAPERQPCPECGAEPSAVSTNGWICGSYRRFNNIALAVDPPVRQSDMCLARHWERRCLAAEAEGARLDLLLKASVEEVTKLDEEVARLRALIETAAGDIGTATPEQWMDGMGGTR